MRRFGYDVQLIWWLGHEVDTVAAFKLTCVSSKNKLPRRLNIFQDEKFHCILTPTTILLR